MLTKEKLGQILAEAIRKTGINASEEVLSKITIDYPEPQFGDYSTNAALMLAKGAKLKPQEVAQKIIDNINYPDFLKIEIAGPGFLNFTLKPEALLADINDLAKNGVQPSAIDSQRILIEYFQPNIAKPLHIGHLRTAIIGDAIKRMLLFLGYNAESDTHLGDWGTQFGLLVLAYKKWGNFDEIAIDPINKLNELYIRINKETEIHPDLREEGKLEFVKLEKGDAENRKIWQHFVDWSKEKFSKINDLMDILPFDHDWPESFFEDRMPAVLDLLRHKNLLKESQGAQIVDLEEEKLGVAVLVKSDSGTTYLLRDLATYIFRQDEQGFDKQLYVVDNRQSFHFQQMFAILRKLEMNDDISGSAHIDYGYMSFKGEALSTRKGNMVLADEVISTAEKKVADIIKEKNPDLKNQQEVIKAVSRGALKYYDLSHNRHSDIDFDWDQALDFEGNSGPYLQYTYARFSSILRKVKVDNVEATTVSSDNYKRLAFMLTIFTDKVKESMNDFLPNILANYLYDLSKAMNHFYHESSIDKEQNMEIKKSKLALVSASRNVLSKGLELLGIKSLEEM